MKVGDIIRSTTKLGRYIKITDIHKDGSIFGIYMSKIGNISEEVRLPEDKYETQKIYRLAISKEELEQLRKYPSVISHEATTNWNNLVDTVLEDGIDLLMFYNKHKKVYYTWEGLKQVYRYAWNSSKTRCKRVPCVTIILGTLIAVE
jgi:intein/homing endonuclease